MEEPEPTADTSGHHNSARGDQLIVRRAHPVRSPVQSVRPFIRRRQSATSGYVRASSSHVVAHRRPSPTSRVLLLLLLLLRPSSPRLTLSRSLSLARAVCAVRGFRRATGVRAVRVRRRQSEDVSPVVCLSSARKHARGRVSRPCRRAGSSRRAAAFRARANAGASSRPRRDDPAASGAADRIDVNVAARRGDISPPPPGDGERRRSRDDGNGVSELGSSADAYDVHREPHGRGAA